MTAHRQPTDWQMAFLGETRTLTDDPHFPIRLNERRQVDSLGHLVLLVTIETGDVAREPGGLALGLHEQVEVHVRKDSARPPAVTVAHDRFVGAPHVLYGRELCLYLDPAREWDPAGGAIGFFNRLYDWLADAAEGRFSARDSLYHAIGGVPAGAENGEMLTVRTQMPDKPALFWATRRSARRIDIRGKAVEGAVPAVFLPVAAPLPYGVGDTIGTLIDRLKVAEDSNIAMMVRTLQNAANRPAAADGMYMLLGIPHPAGGERHVAAGWIDEDGITALRAITPATAMAAITWRAVSDDRPGVSTRRDVETHAAGFLGTTVTLIGCGALGSWFAEFVVRAGVARIVLADPAMITRGLLVRQNYVELDVGRPKDGALAARLQAIADDVDVDVLTDLDHSAAVAAFTGADFIVDATANLAAGVDLETASTQLECDGAVLARLATDPSTGSRGIVTVRGIGDNRSLASIDHTIGRSVLEQPQLEAYHGFWRRAAPSDQVTPVRGCSIPTFHGSAADEAAVAAMAVSALGRHRGGTSTGAHLFALPTGAADAPPALWVDAPAAGMEGS
jgi:hypothetical protein